MLAVFTLSAVDAEQAPSGHPNQGSVESQVNRVDRGLLPAVIIHGQPVPTMTLADRMGYYHVLGVSIALLDHGHVAWARGYGIADVTANKPVTPETLFQAASVSKSVTVLAALAVRKRANVR